MASLNLDKLIAISPLAERLKAARLEAKKAQTEAEKAQAALGRIEAELRAALEKAGLTFGEEIGAKAVSAKSAGAMPKPASPPEGVLTQRDYARRLGYSDSKNLRSLKETGAIPADAVTTEGGIIVAKADAGILGGYECGKCKDRARNAVLAAQARERSEASENLDYEPPGEDGAEEPFVEPGSADEVLRAIAALAESDIAVFGPDATEHYTVDEPGQPQRRVKAPALIFKARQLAVTTPMAAA